MCARGAGKLARYQSGGDVSLSFYDGWTSGFPAKIIYGVDQFGECGDDG